MPVRHGEVPILSPPAGWELPDFATPTSVNETWSGQGRALGQSRSDQNQGGASTQTYSPLSVGHLFSNFGNFKYLGMDHDGVQSHHLTELQARKQTPDSPSTGPVTCLDMMQPGPMLTQPVASASSQLHFPQPNGAAPWEIRSDLSAQVNTISTGATEGIPGWGFHEERFLPQGMPQSDGASAFASALSSLRQHDILRPDDVPEPFKDSGPSHAVQVAEEIFDKFDEDKNGSLPLDVIPQCAAAVWDALHFDGPAFSSEQMQTAALKIRTPFQTSAGMMACLEDFASFREFLTWYEAIFQRLSNPNRSSFSTPVVTPLPTPYASRQGSPRQQRPRSELKEQELSPQQTAVHRGSELWQEDRMTQHMQDLSQVPQKQHQIPGPQPQHLQTSEPLHLHQVCPGPAAPTNMRPFGMPAQTGVNRTGSQSVAKRVPISNDIMAHPEVMKLLALDPRQALEEAFGMETGLEQTLNPLDPTAPSLGALTPRGLTDASASQWPQPVLSSANKGAASEQSVSQIGGGQQKMASPAKKNSNTVDAVNKSSIAVEEQMTLEEDDDEDFSTAPNLQAEDFVQRYTAPSAQLTIRNVSLIRSALDSSAAPLTAEQGSSKVGIGLKFSPNNKGQHVVTSLKPGGAADSSKAIFPGDIIMAVDSVAVTNETSTKVVELIVGVPGSKIELSFLSNSPASTPAASAVPAQLLPTPTMAPQIYICDFGCGFRGSFAEVSSHEMVCTLKLASSISIAEQHQRTVSNNAYGLHGRRSSASIRRENRAAGALRLMPALHEDQDPCNDDQEQADSAQKVASGADDLRGTGENNIKALFGMDEAEWEKVQEERRRRLAAKELVVMPSQGSAQSQQSEARQNTTEMKEDDQKARVEATADQVQAKAAAWARQEMAALFGVSGEVTQETKAANKSKTSVEGQIKAGAETMEEEGACSDAKAGVAQKSVSPPEELLHPKDFLPAGVLPEELPEVQTALEAKNDCHVEVSAVDANQTDEVVDEEEVVELCVGYSLASALRTFGALSAAETVASQAHVIAKLDDPLAGADKIMHEQGWLSNSLTSSFDPLKDMSPLPTLLHLRGTSRAVTTLGHWIFDSSETHALPLTLESLQHCARRYKGIMRGYRFKPGQPEHQPAPSRQPKAAPGKSSNPMAPEDVPDTSIDVQSHISNVDAALHKAQVLLTRFELDPRKASASALEGKAQVTSDESGQKDTADAESGLERQESGVKMMVQSSSQQTEARRENAGSESLDKGPTLMDEARSLTAEAVRRTRQAELDADSVMSAQHALSLSTPSRFMGEGLAGISEDTEASTQNQTTEATLMENRNDGKASSGEDNANVASGVNALGRISNLLIGKSI